MNKELIGEWIERMGDVDSITIPDSVTSIDCAVAFDMRTDLTSVKIPSSVNYPGEDVFEGCTKLGKKTAVMGKEKVAVICASDAEEDVGYGFIHHLRNYGVDAVYPDHDRDARSMLGVTKVKYAIVILTDSIMEDEYACSCLGLLQKLGIRKFDVAYETTMQAPHLYATLDRSSGTLPTCEAILADIIQDSLKCWNYKCFSDVLRLGVPAEFEWVIKGVKGSSEDCLDTCNKLLRCHRVWDIDCTLAESIVSKWLKESRVGRDRVLLEAVVTLLLTACCGSLDTSDSSINRSDHDAVINLIEDLSDEKMQMVREYVEQLIAYQE